MLYDEDFFLEPHGGAEDPKPSEPPFDLPKSADAVEVFMSQGFASLQQDAYVSPIDKGLHFAEFQAPKTEPNPPRPTRYFPD